MDYYSLIDLGTDLVSGPYSSFNEARSRANNYQRWEIIRDADEALIDWSDVARPAITTRVAA